MTDDPRANDRVTVYKDAAGEWRWRRSADNGRIISGSEEGYQDRAYAFDIARDLNSDVSSIVVEE